MDALFPQGRIFTGEGPHIGTVAVMDITHQEGHAILSALHKLLQAPFKGMVLVLVADHHSALLLAGNVARPTASP